LTVEMEGDVMANTPTAYWTERLALNKQFISALPQTKLGTLEVQMTGQSELWALDASLVGAPQIPIGLAGATISPWRIVLAGNDPWFRGAVQQQQTIVGLTSTVLTTLGNGNAPSWPEFTITGPITNPSIDIQGASGAVAITFALSAGQTIVINMRDRTVRTGSGTNLYSVTSVPYGWFPLDPRFTNKNYKLNGSSTTGATQTVVRWYNSYVI